MTVSVQSRVGSRQALLTQLVQVFSLSSDRVYPMKLGLSLDEAKRMWFRLLFADESSGFPSSTFLREAEPPLADCPLSLPLQYRDDAGI